jgi:small subunit ribosomal protein S17
MPKKKKEEIEKVVEETAEVSSENVEAESVQAQTETAEAEIKAKTGKKAGAKKKTETTAKEAKTTADTKLSKRAERVGIVSSDKMSKTVVVRVDRLIKHPIYRKYVKRRKKFMAHDELGAGIGDKVRIVETRPLSARKRWRVVEIIQKAEK